MQFVLSALFASAFAAPHYVAAPNGLAYAHTHLAAPVAYAAAPAAVSLPAPHITQEQAPAVTTIHKPEPIVTKQVHLGQSSYISGYATEILKPAIPDFRIAVPTALKGSQEITAPIVTVEKEIHTVNEPVHVEKPYNVPYDVIKPVEKIVEVPVAVHVAKPVPVPTPVAVQGEPIIQRTVGQPIVRNHYSNVVAQPTLLHGAQIAHHAGYIH